MEDNKYLMKIIYGKMNIYIYNENKNYYDIWNEYATINYVYV